MDEEEPSRRGAPPPVDRSEPRAVVNDGDKGCDNGCPWDPTTEEPESPDAEGVRECESLGTAASGLGEPRGDEVSRRGAPPSTVQLGPRDATKEEDSRCGNGRSPYVAGLEFPILGEPFVEDEILKVVVLVGDSGGAEASKLGDPPFMYRPAPGALLNMGEELSASDALWTEPKPGFCGRDA